MEVINIDSSDDEEVPAKGRVGASRGDKDGASQHYVTQDTNPLSDDSSVSSDDSFIWNTAGLPSNAAKRSAASYKSPLEELEIMGGGDDTNAVGSDVPNPKKSIPIRSSLENENVVGVNEAEKQRHTREDTDDSSNSKAPTVDAWIGNWKVMMLMDVREFGQHKGSDFLEKTEKKINKHFNGVHCEKLSLPSADYMFVARLISNTNGEIIDERVLDSVIERKNVNDLQLCLTKNSKKYKPLSFFEAQMFKLQHCGVPKKLFLMEGDEDNLTQFSMISAITGVATKNEQINRLKRVKTIRIQIEKGEWHGVDVISTKHKEDSVKFLIQQLEMFKKSFNPMQLPTMTMEDLKNKINEEMTAPTFCEYLRQRSMPAIGDAWAMKVIKNPKLEWDKDFISPSGRSKKGKSTLEDRATFWGESAEDAVARQLANARAHAFRSNKSGGVYTNQNKDGDPTCGLCRKAVDIWTETGVATCDRVSKCGATFHESCLTAQGYAIGKEEGCIMCKGLSKFSVKSQEQGSKKKAKKNGASPTALSGDQNSSTPSSQSSRGKKSLAATSKTSSKNNQEPRSIDSSKATTQACKNPYSRKSSSHVTKSGNTKDISATSTSEKEPKKATSWVCKNPYSTKSPSPATASKNTKVSLATSSSEKDSEKATCKRKAPYAKQKTSEQLYIKRPTLAHQPPATTVRITSIDRNGCPSNPLHDIGKSVVAALLLNDTLPNDSGDRGLGSAKKKKNAASTASAKKKKNTKAGGLEGAQYSESNSRRKSTNDSSKYEINCGICNNSIDIWAENDNATCNRVAKCGATFHQTCLSAHYYDLKAHDGCIKCEPKSNFFTKGKGGRKKRAPAMDYDDVIVLDSDDEKKDDDDVIVID